MTNEHQPLRVAIIGGGIAGACLIHALTKYKHLDANIYEAAPSLKEAGYTIGVSRNAFQALSLIGPSAVNALDRAGAVKQSRVSWNIGEGPDAGQELDSIRPRLGDRVVRVAQRTDILRELLQGVPPERLHANKKLVQISQNGDDDSVSLSFTDGTTHHADIVIGADGIHSFVRSHILGEDNPAAKPILTPWYNLWAMLPFERAREMLGADLISKDDPGQYFWWGDGTFIMHTISDNARQVQLVACAMDPALDGKAELDRTKQLDKEIEKAKFKNWPPHFYQAVVDLVDSTPTLKPLHLWESPPAHTYAAGPIAIIGDAAHGMTPWQGAGGGTAIEDAPILSALLGASHTPAEAQIALRVYDEVRRPRTQRCVESSRAVGMVSTGGEGLSAEGLGGRVLRRWDHIIEYDCEKARDEAVGVLEGRLGR